VSYDKPIQVQGHRRNAGRFHGSLAKTAATSDVPRTTKQRATFHERRTVGCNEATRGAEASHERRSDVVRNKARMTPRKLHKEGVKRSASARKWWEFWK
jgi:hypothetical protein